MIPVFVSTPIIEVALSCSNFFGKAWVCFFTIRGSSSPFIVPTFLKQKVTHLLNSYVQIPQLVSPHILLTYYVVDIYRELCLEYKHVHQEDLSSKLLYQSS